MTELCNAFKKQYQNTLQSQKQNPQTPRAPNMTPFGGRTPGGSRTPGGARTPGGGVRPPGMGGTPQVFAGGATPVVRPPGMGTPVMAQPWGAGTPLLRHHIGNATPRPPGMGTPINRPPMQCRLRSCAIDQGSVATDTFLIFGVLDAVATPNSCRLPCTNEDVSLLD